MGSKHIFNQLVIRIIGITAASLFFAFFYIKNQSQATIIFGMALVLQTVLLIRYMNTTNRKMAYFFDSLRNEDFTLRFPENVATNSFQDLHKNLNKVNDMIKETQAKSKAQESYYQEILKQAHIGLLTFNSKGHILYSNPMARTWLNCGQLSHIRQLEHIDKGLFQWFSHLESPDKKLLELTNERETTKLMLKSAEIKLNGQMLNLITVQDIKQELDEKETDSWIKLIKVLTHEIMNAIAPITSISESILSYYGNDKPGSTPLPLDDPRIKNTIKGLEVIKNQGNDLQAFVGSYRSFLNVPAPDKKIIAVVPLFEKLKLLAEQQTAGDNIKVEVNVSPEAHEVYADEAQISHVLTNLCKNALQSMHNKGHGRMQLISTVANDGQKCILVKDDGPGIPDTVIDHVFVPFFTTKKNGSGVGLSLSRQIMRLHGGNLKVQSTPDVETVFSLYFG